MGWIKSKLKNIWPQKARYADALNGYTPIFSQFGQDIYASDVVRQAVDCIVKEICKLEPCFVRKAGNDYQPMDADVRNIQKILNKPNPLMGKTDFLEKLGWQLFLNDNAFAVPIYEQRKNEDGSVRKIYRAIYPISPIQVTFLEDPTERVYVEFCFANGYKTTIPYEDVIHIRNNYSVNDYMGGGIDGQPDHKALLETLQLNKDLLAGVSAAMRGSFSINGVVKTTGLLSEEKMDAAIKEFEEKLQRSQSGILHLDGKSEYNRITKDVKLVDNDTLKFIDEKILRHFGVSIPILTGDYTKEQYEAFYQKTIEPLVSRLGECFTRTLCTDRMVGHGERVVFFTHELIFMSAEQKLEMIKYLGDTGTIFENEKRVAMGMPPVKELDGIRKQSLNYIDASIISEYQLLKAKGGMKEDA